MKQTAIWLTDAELQLLDQESRAALENIEFIIRIDHDPEVREAELADSFNELLALRRTFNEQLKDPQTREVTE